MVIQTLLKNAANAQNMIKEIIKTFRYSVEKDPANNCLDVAIITIRNQEQKNNKEIAEYCWKSFKYKKII